MANLFIGMGGSGVKTLREIQKKQNKNESKNNHFLFIDTDSREFIGMNPDDYLDLGSANVINFINHGNKLGKQRKNMDKWFDTACTGILTNTPLKEGASAIRPQGRAAVAELYTDFVTIVRRKIDGLTNLINENNDKNESNEINVYIVLSVAGGTGSSIFLDLSYLINDIIVEKSIGQVGIIYSPWVIFYMPDGFVKFNADKEHVKSDYRSNVFATWKEIDAVLRDYYVNGTTNDGTEELKSGRTYFSDWAISDDKINAKNFKFLPFSNALLIDYTNEKGKQISIENNQLYKNVAQFLCFISIGEFGGKFRSDFNNTLKRNAWNSIVSKEKWVKQFTSAGYSEIRGGSFLFDRYCQFQLRKSLTTALIGNKEDDIIKLEMLLNDMLSRNLFNRIEADGFNKKYQNKAEGSVPNSQQILKNALAKINTHYDELSICEKMDEVKVAAESIHIHFKSISDLLVNSFKDDLKRGGFDEKKTAAKFLENLYLDLSNIVITDGFRLAQQILDKADEEIDNWFINYDNEFKQLDSKNVIGFEGLKNKDLFTQINASYSKIISGEGLGLMDNKNKWYVRELNLYKDYIKAYIKYKSDEILIESKMNVCFEISAGPNGDILSRKRVREMIGKLSSEIDIEIHKDEQVLIQEFRSYSDDPLTRIVPDVSKYVDGFENAQINLFKEKFENECGLSFSKDALKKVLTRKKSNENSVGSVTLQELLDITINEKEYIVGLFNGTVSTDKFLTTFKECLETQLETQSLRATLPKYSEISTLKLKDWVVLYQSDFDRYKADFIDRASLFCSLNKAPVTQKMWVTSTENRPLCNEILNFNRASVTSIESTVGITSEDVVALIKMAQNISFDDYTNYQHYYGQYSDSMKTNPNVMYPHIDVRFKREMMKFPQSADDNVILQELLKRGLDHDEQSDADSYNPDRFINAFTIYAKLYFLAEFYQLLKSNSINLSYFIDSEKDNYGVLLEIPVSISEGQITYYHVSKTLWGTATISSNNMYSYALYTKDLLLSEFRKSVFGKEHNPLWQNIVDYQTSLDSQINVIKIVKIKERAHTVKIQDQLNSAIKKCAKYFLDIIPIEESKKLKVILDDIIESLTKI